ncbi:hypothetical protein OIV83_003438 [Microbotryomycetes sp. JL201]|nr:hypothetical protein OIV83_003438 [Microbotryomycetes sp. JL201]
MGVARDLVLALAGDYGSAGLYGSLQRVFGLLSVMALPLCLVINAPFGKWSPASALTVNGTAGWLLMELVAPITFMHAMLQPLTTIRVSPWPTSLSIDAFRQAFPYISIERFSKVWSALPYARRLLAGLYVLHYVNRSIISSMRNPSRANMSLLVPLFAILFNLANATLIGLFVQGGFADLQDDRHQKDTWGIKVDDKDKNVYVFWIGVVFWALGFVGNIVCDEMLYSLKRQSIEERKAARKNDDSKNKEPLPSRSSRYKIPKGFLYEYVSHPAYLCEWIEWTGFAIAASTLQPSPLLTTFTSQAKLKQLLNAHLKPAAQRGLTLKLLRGLPKHLRPLTDKPWLTDPPSLFLWAEIAAMLPRAIRGHEWYTRTFGQDWPRDRKIIIPFVY